MYWIPCFEGNYGCECGGIFVKVGKFIIVWPRLLSCIFVPKNASEKKLLKNVFSINTV